MPKILSLLVATFLFATPALANQQEFCAGFEEGYKAIKGNMVMVPMCPMAPMTPMGSTPFQEGIKVGMAKALKN